MTAVSAFALGIGANAAIFSVVHAVLLRSLPYAQPEQLVKVWGQMTREGLPKLAFSDPEYFELADTNRSFDGVAAFLPVAGANLGSDESAPQRITRGFSTASLFSLVGVKPVIGRTYSADDAVLRSVPFLDLSSPPAFVLKSLPGTLFGCRRRCNGERVVAAMWMAIRTADGWPPLRLFGRESWLYCVHARERRVNDEKAAVSRNL